MLKKLLSRILCYAPAFSIFVKLQLFQLLSWNLNKTYGSCYIKNNFNPLWPLCLYFFVRKINEATNNYQYLSSNIVYYREKSQQLKKTLFVYCNVFVLWPKSISENCKSRCCYSLLVTSRLCCGDGLISLNAGMISQTPNKQNW